MEFGIKISVVMPVYNTPLPYLKEAVESILRQTFRDFEFIIIDDGSDDAVREYLENLRDPRILLIRNGSNLGITRSLNIGLWAARGKYIARMDGDDVSSPDRFEKQVGFMKTHPDVIACGTRIKTGEGKLSFVKAEMETMERYRVRMLFVNPGPVHSTAMLDHEKLLRYHIEYDEQLVYAQDYGLWMTLSDYGRICTLQEELLTFRNHPDRISNRHREEQIRCDKMVQRKLLEIVLDEVTEAELDLHYVHSTGYFPEAVITPLISDWYDRLTEANRRRHIYDQKLLQKYIERIKVRLIYNTLAGSATTCEMTKMKRAWLFFRYLPFKTAVAEILKIMKLKAERRFFPDRIG